MTADSSIDYRPVVFRDRAAGYAFLTRSTATSETTIEWDDGNTYPVVDVEISSESHPFYTGKARTVDTEGRIAAFERKYGDGGADDGASGRATSGVTPDALLHSSPEGEVSAEDLVLASGRDVTEENLERARRRLAERGRAAVEEQLP